MSLEKSEYEVLYFGFSAMQISIERKYALREILDGALNSMLKSVTKGVEIPKSLMAECKEEVLSRMRNAYADQIAAIDALDTKYHTIPNHILFNSDIELTKQFTAEDERRKNDEIAELKHNFLENCVMISALKMENEKYAAIESFIEDECKVNQQVLDTRDIIDYNKLEKLSKGEYKVDNSNDQISFS